MIQTNDDSNQRFGVDFNITFRKLDITDYEMVQKFSCGNRALDDFIRYLCFNNKQYATYLFVENSTNTLISFCALSSKGITAYQEINDKAYCTQFPEIEIEFFAVDDKYRKILIDKNSQPHETLSRTFLLVMLKQIDSVISTHVGVQYVCLYSVRKAVNFYKRCGFKEFKDFMSADESPFLDNCIPMFLKL